MEVTIDVHGGPCEGDHTRAEFVLKIFKVGYEQALSVGPNLVDDSIILSQNKVELTVVHLELILKEEDYLGTLGDVYSDS